MRSKLIIAIGLIVAAVAYLGFTAVKSSAVYYLTAVEVQQAMEQGDSQIFSRRLRISGQADKATKEWDPQTLTLKFDLIEETARIPVVYQGPVPDTFDRSTGVIVEGRFDRNGVFRADTLFVQCPSKYEVELENQGNQ